MINKLLDDASAAYYSGNPIMSDDEFDKFAEIANYQRVGTTQGAIPHVYQMYSLQKVLFGEVEPTFSDPVKTVKLDGAAISALYLPLHNNLVLSTILTRGDGKRGHDITDKLCHLLPGMISGNKVTQVNCEVVAPKSIANSRNYAAGALNLKDPAEVRARDLEVFAHDVTGFNSYLEGLEYLTNQRFYTVLDNTDNFPNDGYVVRENSTKLFEAMGYTSKFPRGAYALKPKAESVFTKLLAVTWQVGRTGVVSPVAILEPVMIAGATISRATLHNIAVIEALNLEIGCTVEVIRAGEIIPRIVGRR